jgi:hypothetical protein
MRSGSTGPRPRSAGWLPCSTTVDVVLLVHRTFQVHAETGFGDFAVDQLGSAPRRREREIVPYIFAGASLMRPTLLDGMPPARSR